MKQRFVVFLLSMFYSVSVFCQPRTNGVNKFKIEAQSQSIIEPVGWYYSSFDEKWCGCYGICIGEYKRNDKIPRRLTDSDISGSGNRGIYSLHIAKAKAEEKNFYLLYHIYWDGEWDYPALQVGWKYYKSCSVWVMTESEYNKLINPNIGVNIIQLYDYTMTARYLTQEGKDHLKSGLNNIISEALTTGGPVKENAYWKYKLYVKLEDDGKTIRFKLPTYEMLWSEAQKINAENELKKQNDKRFFYSPIDKYECVDFATDYFEVSKVQFDKLKIQ